MNFKYKNKPVMNIVTSFAIYVSKNKIDINRSNADQVLNDYKKKLVAETATMEMCDHELSVGDYVEVQIVSSGHLNGGMIKGRIKALFPHIPQVQLESGWCFHPSDKILIHKKATVEA